MALPQALIKDNPWWRDPASIGEDYQLKQLEDQPFTHQHDFKKFNFRKDAVYTLRGPRQVGKTTLLKTIIRYLLQTKNYHIRPRDILYFNVQAVAVSSHNDLLDMVQDYIEERRSVTDENRLYIFFDEVTGITDWGKAIQSLHGRGLLDRVFVLATGSHALDIQRGGERMPGRRGDIDDPDWILMPLSFRDYVKAIADQTDVSIPGDLPEIDLYDVKHSHEQALELEMSIPPIGTLFQRYMRTGGYPYAIAAEMEYDQIPRRVYEQFQQAIREEMRKAGRREQYFRELVSWAVDKYLGQEFSWNKASRDTHIGSKNTARDYLEDGEAVFIWHIMNRAKKLGEPTPAHKSPKKLYTVDPFCWHSLTAWVQGIMEPWGHTLEVTADNDFLGTFVESIVADHFKRRFGPFGLFHRASQGKEEIDFVLHRTPDENALVEVKYRNSLEASDRKYLEKYGGGILATKDQFQYHESEKVASIPVYDLLAGLPYDLTLFPSRD